MRDPVVLLLDEPTWDLDPLNTYFVISILANHAKKVGFTLICLNESFVISNYFLIFQLLSLILIHFILIVQSNRSSDNGKTEVGHFPFLGSGDLFVFR